MLWKPCLCGLVLTSFFASSQFAAQDRQSQTAAPEGSGEKDQKTTAEARAPRKLQVFTLKHCLPSEFVNLLSVRRQRVERQVPGGFPGQVQIEEYQALPENVNVAVEDQKRKLFVRGPVERIKEIETLVKEFDVVPDKLKKHSFGKVHLIPLRGQSAGQAQSILSQLGIQTQVAQLGQAFVVCVTDSDKEELAQVEEVIAELNDNEPEGATNSTEAVKTTTTEERR